MQTDKSSFSDRLVSLYLYNKHSQFLDEIKYPMTYNIRNKELYI